MRRTGCARNPGNQASPAETHVSRPVTTFRIRIPPNGLACSYDGLKQRHDLDLGHVRSTVRRIKKRLHFELE
jgi:hypothetical protein